MANGTFGSDVLIVDSDQDAYGLFGADTLGSKAGAQGVALIGGQGDDTYNVGANGTTLVVEDGYSTGDAITIGDDFNNSRFYIADGRHLVVTNNITGAELVVADWQATGHTIETWHVDSQTYDYATFRTLVFQEITGDDSRAALTDIFSPTETASIRQSIASIPSTEGTFEAQSLDATFTDAKAVYRFYNQANGQHFYTASAAERDSVVQKYDQFVFEGPVFDATTQGSGNDVYRFYNTQTQEHFYTISAAERDFVNQNYKAYNYEGVAYQAHGAQTAGADPLYRFYDVATQTHFYTSSAAEKDSVLAHLPSYHFEGVAYYVDHLA